MPRTTFNYAALFAETAESLFWLGFLSARALFRGTKIELNFKIELIETVSAFQKFIGLNKQIPIYKNGYSSIGKLHFSSGPLFQKLEELGVVSGNLRESLRLSKDFWRGYLEGRARLVVKDYPKVRVYFRNCNVCNAFEQFVKSNVKSTVNKSESGTLHVSLIGTTARILIELLFRENSQTRHSKAVKLALRWTPKKISLVKPVGWEPATADSSVFESATNDCAYWIGFLTADGYIADGSVTISQNSKDAGHVHKFAEFIKCNRAPQIESGTTNYGNFVKTKLSISNKKLADSVKKWGLSKNKSCNETVHSAFAKNPHFWRGQIDGDGTVNLYTNYNRKYPTIKTCGSKKLIQAFIDYAVSIGLKRLHPKAHPRSKNLYYAGYNGMPGKILINAIYGVPGPALDRKLKNAKKCIEWEKAVPYSTRRKTPKEIIDKIVNLRNKGTPLLEIANECGVSLSVVKKYRTEFCLA